MWSRWQLQKIKTVDCNQFHSRKISERLFDAVVFIVDDKRSSLHDISSVPHLPLSASNLFGLLALLNVFISIQTLQQSNCCFCFCEALYRIGADDRYLWDSFNLMSTGHQKWRDRTGCECRTDGISPMEWDNIIKWPVWTFWWEKYQFRLLLCFNLNYFGGLRSSFHDWRSRCYSFCQNFMFFMFLLVRGWVSHHEIG